MYRNKGFGAHAHFHNKGSWIGWFQKGWTALGQRRSGGPLMGWVHCSNVGLFFCFYFLLKNINKMALQAQAGRTRQDSCLRTTAS